MASPATAVLAPSVRATLARLAGSPRARVAVLSGRSLADVRARVGLAGVVYGGCHGLQIRGGGLAFRHPGASAARVAAARRALARGAAAIPGARVEWKGLAVSLHYRQVARARQEEARRLAARVARRMPDLRAIPGHAVVDFVPRVRWSKGEAARYIVRGVRASRRARAPLVLYAGDDVTDEAAFAALRPTGITVRVGRRRGGAEYSLRDVGQVHALLHWLVAALA